MIFLFFYNNNKNPIGYFQVAQKLFQISFTNCKQRLANLAKTLGRCVERARPYYNACRQTEEVISQIFQLVIQLIIS